MPGTPPPAVDQEVVDGRWWCARRAGLLIDRRDFPALDPYLNRSGPGFCLHESLDTYEVISRRLLDWIREFGGQTQMYDRGVDLVHAVFHPGNVLVNEDGEITGVIDWAGGGRCDRRFGLVTLAFDLDCGTRFSIRYTSLSPAAMQRVSERLDSMDEDLFRL